MSAERFEWVNLRCLYAEMLKNNRVTLTVAAVRNAPERLFCPGKRDSSGAWDIGFAEKDKEGHTLYMQIPSPGADGKACGLLRTWRAATGGDPSAESIGQKVTLLPVESKRSATGQAIRIAIPERNA